MGIGAVGTSQRGGGAIVGGGVVGSGVGCIVESRRSGVEAGRAGAAGTVTVDARVDGVAHVGIMGAIVRGYTGIIGAVASSKGCT